MFKSVLLILTASVSFPALALEKSISVSGDCLRRVSQDRGAVTLTAESTDANAANASTKSSEIYNKLREKVKKMGLKDLQLETAEINLFEDFDYTNSGRKSKGFRARNGLRVESSEVNRLGEVLKAGTEAGIKNISSIQTFVSAELLKTEREACLEEAFKNAKSKADRLIKAAGAKLGPVIELSENNSGIRQPRPVPMMMETKSASMIADAAGGEPQIESRQDTVNVSIGVIFSIQ